MSRTIKFRAWDKSNRKYWNNWSNAFLLSLEGEFLVTVSGDAGEIEAINPSPEAEKRFVLEQFTGKLDKNGKEIYDGDRIYFSASNSQHYRGVIVWSESRCGWSVAIEWEKTDSIPGFCMGYEMSFLQGNERLASFDRDGFDIEIVGSIHDNPELLETGR